MGLDTLGLGAANGTCGAEDGSGATTVKLHKFHHGCFDVVPARVEEQALAYDANLFPV
jgi:hypothetical protein